MTVATGAALRTFGRRAQADPRDLRYLLSTSDPERVTGVPVRRITVARGPVYDQEDKPLGIACALLAALHAAPQRIGPGRTPHPDVLDVAAQALVGSLLGQGETLTLRSGCQALRHLHLIDGYHWSFDLDEIVSYLGSGRGLVLSLIHI